MDWYASACSATDCSVQTPANNRQTITLVESADGGLGSHQENPINGEAHDFISPTFGNSNLKASESAHGIVLTETAEVYSA
jgi:hypothetical protein